MQYGDWKESFRSQPVIATERTGAAILTDLFYYKKKDPRVILLNNCADKWQLHSITFQWEHYSHNIGNGKTFSPAFQLGDDVWKEPIGGVRHRHGELMRAGATSERKDTREQRDNRALGRLTLLPPAHKGVEGRINPRSKLPWGVRGGRRTGSESIPGSAFAQRGSPLRRERAPIPSYYGWGQWNDVPGNWTKNKWKQAKQVGGMKSRVQDNHCSPSFKTDFCRWKCHFPRIRGKTKLQWRKAPVSDIVKKLSEGAQILGRGVVNLNVSFLSDFGFFFPRKDPASEMQAEYWHAVFHFWF